MFDKDDVKKMGQIFALCVAVTMAGLMLGAVLVVGFRLIFALAGCAPYEREEPIAGRWCENGELRAEITRTQITYYGFRPPRVGEWVRETGIAEGEMSVHWLSGVDWGDGTYDETLRYHRAGRWLTLESESVQMPFTMEVCK